MGVSQALLDKIFALDRRIRFAAAFDRMGTLLTGGMRKDVASIEPPSASEKIYAQLAILDGIIRTFAEHFGEPDFQIFKHDKINVLLFPCGESYVAVSTETTFPLNKVSEIRRLISKAVA